MLDSFYAAFVEELQKIAAGEPRATFEEWRKHFETTGRKSMKKKPSAAETILGKEKEATITKRVTPTPNPSGGHTLDWFGDPATKTKTKKVVQRIAGGRRF